MEINLTALLEIPSISRVFLWFFTALTLRTWFSQEGFFSQGIKGNRFGKAVKSNGHCIDLLSRRVYQGFFCHVGVTSIIASTFYWRTLFITRPIKLKGGYAKANIFFPVLLHCICSKTFWIWLPCYILGSWWHSLEGNRPTAGVFKNLVIFRKTFWWNSQLDKPALIVIWWDSRQFQIDMFFLKLFGLWAPLIFKRHIVLSHVDTLLSTWTWMLTCDKFFVKFRIVDFNTSNCRILYENAPPPLAILPLSKLPCSMSSSLLLKAHLKLWDNFW